ncbi:hypothetical protein [Lactococcus garvieae]|uniref:Uncharacterized protein n=1 Tax=Lactococcus garvieae DCC43 TaxID=1231377 RepID=K2PLM6_9LACT|nr:hypothetical protein [Lactococcus garvieae]EKF52255.1 hypothetical protein C426_0341 [Lactococcus garvieae DCC43]
MTKPDYSDIVKKNEAAAKHRRFITTKNGKIRGFLQGDIILLSTSESGFKMNKLGFPVKMTVSTGFVEQHKLKKQAKRDLKAYRDKDTMEPLFTQAFEQSMSNKLNGNSPYWVGIELYWAGYARGIREQRQSQREHQAKLSNIGALTGNDIADLAQALSIDINKLNTAVLELTASRKVV